MAGSDSGEKAGAGAQAKRNGMVRPGFEICDETCDVTMRNVYILVLRRMRSARREHVAQLRSL